jgi:hypothetical protein
MNIAEKWNEIASEIEAKIEASPERMHSISRERFRRTYGLTPEQVHELLMLNAEQERFRVEEVFHDYEFRPVPNA